MGRFVLCCMLVVTAPLSGQVPGFEASLQRGKDLMESDSAAAHAALNDALKLALGGDDAEGIARSRYALGDYYRHYGMEGRAVEAYEAGIKHAEADGATALLADGHLALGKLYLKMEQYAASIKQHKQVLALPEKWNGPKADAYANIAVNYRHLSRFDSAMTYAVEAQRMYEMQQDTAGWIRCMGIRGNLHLLMRDYDQAKNLFTESESLIIAFRDSVELAYNINHLGVVHQKKGEYPDARSYYRRALAICEVLGLNALAGIVNGNIGSSLMQEGAYSEALPYLKTALALKQAAGSSAGNICHTYMDLSELYRLMGRPDTAAVLALQVRDLAAEAKNGYYLYNGYLYLAAALDASGQHEAAYSNLLVAHNMSDSLLNETKTKQVQELQIAYDSEKKDASIIALEQARRLETKQKQLYLILGLAVLLLGAGAFIQQRNNARKNKLLLAKEKEVDLLKSNFFANMSHEFRTPLTLILGPIEGRLQKTTDADEREELLMMKRNATRLLRLINDILDLSKSEAGQLTLQEVATDITRTVKGIAGSFTSLAASRKVAYVIEVLPSAEGLKGMIDRHKFETVLINLLANAFKFTDKGGTVQILVEALYSREQPQLHCKVRDTGIGIPEEKLEKIFDRFYQVDDAATRKAQGTGIGLAFSAELVKLMQGRLTAKSKVGEGSEFELVLPFKALPEDAFAEAPAPYAVDEEADTKERKAVEEGEAPLVLVVEDNSDVRRYIESILGVDYRLLTARDGREGVDMALEHVPDVVISDVMMPVMDGYALCSALKSDMRSSHIPIILLTAKSSAESRIKGLQHEADVYMSKPFHPVELGLQVRNMLNLHQKLRNKYREGVALPVALPELSSMEQQFFDRLNQVLEANYTDPEFTVEQLSSDMGMSRSQLHRKLKSLMDESATGYVRRYRLQMAHAMLKAGTGSISEIAYQVGFNNVSYFNKCFLEVFGKRPGEVG